MQKFNTFISKHAVKYFEEILDISRNLDRSLVDTRIESHDNRSMWFSNGSIY